MSRVLLLSIQGTNPWGEPTGRTVQPMAPGTDTVSAANFLEMVLPGQCIENLPRAEILDVGGRRRDGSGLAPFSLFFQAVHHCFANHHPLALRPEVMWYLVMHEVAETVRRDPERYRALFTRSSDKELIEVTDNSLMRGHPNSDWSRTLALFDGKLREAVPPGVMEHLLPTLTTHTPESTAASLVAFMDAASPFHDFCTHTFCGIPTIRLDGEPEDWQRLVRSASALAETFAGTLTPYFANLLPVLRTIAAQAAGAPADNNFWGSIYKWRSESGSDRVTGWITAFLAYRKNGKGNLVLKAADECHWQHADGGMAAGAYGAHVSAVPFLWKYLGAEIHMNFVGGVLGVDNDDGFVCPRLGYAITERPAS